MCFGSARALGALRTGGMQKALGGFVLKFAMAIVGFVLWATAAAQALDVPIVFLTRQEEPRLSLSFVDQIVKDPGVWGARLAIEDNNTTGKFLKQKYELIEVTVPPEGDVVDIFETQLKAGHTLFVADLDRDDLLAIAKAPGADKTLIFDGRTRDDDLRTDICFPQVFHTALSRSMRTDALVQFLVWKKWPDIYLMSGTMPGDKAYASAIRRSAQKFGAKIVSETTYAYSPIARRTDSGSIQIQSQMPIITQEGGDYDVLVAADESDIFGEYLPFATYTPRPIAGTQGLVATSWHRVNEQWGASQFQHRFIRLAGRWMEERDYGAWLGVRSIGEAVTRTKSGSVSDLRAYLRSDDFQLGGFKGVGLSFRPWNQQMRQPVLLVNKRILVSVSPQPGFLHQRTVLDTLGYDQPETKCQLQ